MTVLVESQQAIYKVDSEQLYQLPREVWDRKLGKWVKYEGDIPKEIGWADIITPEEAKAFMY